MRERAKERQTGMDSGEMKMEAALGWHYSAFSLGDSMMPYFKYSLLNWLRDEVILTLTRSKVTVLHFFMVAGPTAGVGAGIGYGESRTWVHSLVGATVGGIAGAAIAWPLPRVISHALDWLIR